MGIKTKLFFPLALASLVIGISGIFLLQSRLNDLQSFFLDMMVKDRAASVRVAVEGAASEALKLASLFSRMTSVQDAFLLARTGDMTKADDWTLQLARQSLRTQLASNLKGFESVLGEKLQLHFHLPTGRSLVRMWREKQAKVDGKWVDISDDLSGFRKTVLAVNRTGKPVKGIEPGRGGFAIRGLVPVFGPENDQLGSVEVLVPFEAVIAKMKRELAGVKFQLYMDESLLNITTKLQDPEKYPLINNEFVLVYGKEGNLDVSPGFLTGGFNKEVVEIKGDQAYTAFPVLDYSGAGIGVLVIDLDVSGARAIFRSAMISLGIIVFLIVVAPSAFGLFVVSWVVLRPVKAGVDFAEALSKGNFDTSLNEESKDEFGRLASAMNKIPGTLREIDAIASREAEKIRSGHLLNRLDDSGFEGGFKNLLNSINLMADVYTAHINSFPVPMMMAGLDGGMIFVNKALADTLGMEVGMIHGCSCNDVLSNPNCGGPDCGLVSALESPIFGETVFNVSGEERNFSYTCSPVKDGQGKTVGICEFLMDVSEVKQAQKKSQQVAGFLEREVMALSESMQLVAEGDLSVRHEVGEPVDEAEDLHEMLALITEALNMTVAQLDKTVSMSRKLSEYQTGEVHRLSGVLDIVAEGDLTRAYHPRPSDSETTEAHEGFNNIAESLNQVFSGLCAALGEIQLTAGNLASSSEELSLVSGSLHSGAGNISMQSEAVAEATEQVSTTVGDMASAIEQMSMNASSISATAEEMSTSVGSVATSMERMGESIRTISENAKEGQEISVKAEKMALTAGQTMKALDGAADDIGKVTDLIKRIADQTNLLALNATIEAASAGEAGKGFAVVAGEIKELANQSAKAAEEIAEKIEGVQTNSRNAVTATDEIVEIIQTINSSVTSIAQSVEEQSRATQEVTTLIVETSKGADNIAASISEMSGGANDLAGSATQMVAITSEVSQSIHQVTEAVKQTLDSSVQVNDASGDLAETAEKLRNLTDRFKVG